MNVTTPCIGTLDTRGLIAAVVLGTIGALTIMAAPGFVMLFHAQSQLTDQQLGFVAAWDINATAVAIGLATFLIARVNWRVLAFAGVLLIAVGSAATAMSHGYSGIVAARVCAGLGEGLAIAVSFAALGSAASPDRSFGIYLIVGLVVTSAALALFPILEARFGAPNVFIGVAGTAALTALLLPWLPPCSPKITPATLIAVTWSRHLTFSGLAGVFLYFIAQGAMWSYFERIGHASGVDPVRIGQALAISSFAGGAGSLVAVLLSTRCARAWPLTVSGVISLVSFYLLTGHVEASTLIAAGILFNFAWNLSQPLLSGLCAEADSHGRVVVAMGCIQTIGFGAGPALAATVLHNDDYAPVAWLSAGVLVASLIIVLAGLRIESRRTIAPASAG
ncbi:MAG: MFS transporter [Pseudomonadota bacterium]